MQETDFRERDCMSFDGFCTCVRMDIQKKLGGGFEVSLKDIIKNNDTMLKGLIIMERDTNLYPTIYMECPYDRYSQGESLEEIEDSILQCYEENRTEDFDLSFFMNWESVKDRIMYKLINYDRNRELLKEVPYRKMLDLAVVYEYFLDMDDNRSASILIRNDHMEALGVTADELYAAASKNSPELMGYRLCSIEEIVRDIYGIRVDSLPDSGKPEKNTMPMYVLTNEHKFHGAGCILYGNLLKEIADKWGCDICIIPSSIHETLLIPMSAAGSCAVTSQMVREVNQTQVSPEEILSDHVYQFNRETGEIIMQEEEKHE